MCVLCLARYDAVVLAYGASSDRALGVPGEDLTGVLSAREFVGWYNGAPELQGLNPPLASSDTAVIVGNGNVAIDLARLLTAPPAAFGASDLTSAAMHVLAQSQVRRVVVVGRRGPLECSFTIKELRELTKIAGVHVSMPGAFHPPLTPTELAYVAATRPRQRLTELMQKTAQQQVHMFSAVGGKSVEFLFLRSPVSVLGDDTGNVKGITFEKNELTGEPGQRRVKGTGETQSVQ